MEQTVCLEELASNDSIVAVISFQLQLIIFKYEIMFR